MTAAQARWLSDAQVAALLPPPGEAAELARSVLVELAEGTIELPPKPAIHPRPSGPAAIARRGGLFRPRFDRAFTR